MSATVDRHVQAKLDEIKAALVEPTSHYIGEPIAAQTCAAVRDALAAFLLSDYCASVVPDPRDCNSVLVNVSAPPGLAEINLVI